MADLETKQKPAAPKTATIVAVPVEVFAQVVEKLSEQPYREVGPLLNALGSYRPQEVQIAE